MTTQPPRSSLLVALLSEQQDLSAVETFARAHERGDASTLVQRYRALLPAHPPHPGQQYAFEVDLDRCSGCKACVTGCHNRNGLDDGETWRSVGTLLGGDDRQPLLRHVTTACHHCLDPGCLTGCPVRAYEKDAATGIVRHLDDQCIGCQYCIMKCPYEVPQFSAARGIVRKCDMCADRLAHGEAPACVQSCPTEAIRITLADSALDPATCDQRFAAVPTAPETHHTRPTSAYVSRLQPRPPAPPRRLAAAHSHPSLVAMLVLTQAAIGLFAGSRLAGAAPAVAAAALSLALVSAGMAAAIFHLGRPRWAFRAFLGLPTSWLSREIVTMGVFALLDAAALLAGAVATDAHGAADLAALAGLAAVYCSAMVYRDTPRPHWARAATVARFFLSAAASGVLLALAVGAARGLPLRAGAVAVAALALGAKLAFERYDSTRLAPAETRHLVLDAPPPAPQLRRACAVLALTLLAVAAASSRPAVPLAVAAALWLLGEALERHLFFRAGAAPGMP